MGKAWHRGIGTALAGNAYPLPLELQRWTEEPRPGGCARGPKNLPSPGVSRAPFSWHRCSAALRECPTGSAFLAHRAPSYVSHVASHNGDESAHRSDLERCCTLAECGQIARTLLPWFQIALCSTQVLSPSPKPVQPKEAERHQPSNRVWPVRL